MRQEALDGLEFDALDGLAREAALEIGSVAGLISLLEGGRPFLRAEVGLPLSMAAGQETPLLDSLCLLVAGHRGPLIIEDSQRHYEARVSRTLRRLGIRSCLGFPLVANDRALGSFCVIGEGQRCWQREEVDLAERLAGVAAAHLEARSRDVEPDDLDPELDRLRAGVNDAFFHTAELEEAVAGALEALCRDLAYDVAGAWILDAEGSELECAGHWHRSSLDLEAFSEVCRGLRFRAGEDMVGHVWAKQEPIWSPELPLGGVFPRAAVASAAQLSCALWVPLVAGVHPLGTLEMLATEARPTHARTVQLVPDLGRQLAELIALRRDEASLPSSWFPPGQMADRTGPFTGLPQSGKF
jgi:GAF domain-containing protein